MDGFKIADIFREAKETLEKWDVHVLDTELTSAWVSETYRPLAAEFLKKDAAIFSVPRFFFPLTDFSVFWPTLSETQQNTVWDFLRSGLVSSYIGDDWIKTIKELWTGSGKESSEIDEILADETTKSNFEELFAYLSETQIFKLGSEMMETLTLSQFDLGDLDLSDPTKILDMFKNPDNPVVKKATAVVGGYIEQKIKSGNLTKETLLREIHTIKEKCTHSLGRVFNEAMFGETNSLPSNIVMGNSPEARLVRMKERALRRLKNRK